MNRFGHQAAARIVNSQIGGAFDEAYLMTGSTDPDTHESGYEYSDIESKHHFDSVGESGRLHTAADICTIVSRYVIAARSYWRQGSYGNAAFLFGVATHYYLDGFICSPSVDEDTHAWGDRVFSDKVLEMEQTGSGIVRVTNKEVASSQYVNELSAYLWNDFGTTDPDILPRALGILAEMGRIIADNIAYSVGFQNQVIRCSNRCIEVAEESQRKLQDKLNADYASFIATRKSLLNDEKNVFHYLNDLLLDRRHQIALRFAKFFHLQNLVAEPYYESWLKLKDIKRESDSVVSYIKKLPGDYSSRMLALGQGNDWYSPEAMASCAKGFSDFSNKVCSRICRDIDSFEPQLAHDYHTAVRNQDKEAVGNFLRRYESVLWESLSEREKAESLAGSRVDRFLPWILTLPIGLICSLLCLLSGVVCCLLALTITGLSGLLLSSLMGRRLDLAYKWEALEQLKQDIQYGQGTSAGEIDSKAKPQ